MTRKTLIAPCNLFNKQPQSPISTGFFMSEKTIGFRTSKEQGDKLEALAEQLEMSVSDLIRRALTHGITPAIQEIAAEKKEGAKRALKMVRGENHTLEMCSEGVFAAA